jgi:hypothetical protein
MVETIAERKRSQWQQRVAEQERSGLSVRRYCEQQGLRESALYWWRKRLRTQEPVRFALVDRTSVSSDTGLELVLAGGERLRIPTGVDQATLRTVLDALRP